MDGAVDTVRPGRRLLDLLGEQPLAADLGQRAVLDPVARGGHGDEDGLALAAKGGGDRGAHVPGLGERELRASGADAYLLRGHVDPS